MKKIPEVSIFVKDIPFILQEFVDLLGGNDFFKERLSKKHRFFAVYQFYFQNINRDWDGLNIPGGFLFDINIIAHFVLVLKKILKDASSLQSKPLMCFFKTDLIDTLWAEAQIACEYLKRGCIIKWPSIFSKDPPDLEIYDPQSKVDIDVEVKIKESDGTVDSMFNSLSKGLQSLKRRKKNKDKPAIIAVHNKEDLGWEDWLTNNEVIKRLKSRLENQEYKIVSGIIFSGGSRLKCSENSKQTGTRYLAYTSLVANYKLPEGFL